MPLTTPTGLFTGFNTQEIISKLVAVEQQPLQGLTTRKASDQAKISSYGGLLDTLSKLKTALASLKDDSLLKMSASSSDASVFTASATASATPTNHSINVTNIATAQSLYSTTFATDTAEVADLSVNAVQTLRLQVGTGTAVDITINSTNNSLTGIKDAINNAGIGVTAAVVNDGSNYRLTLAVNTTGASNRLVVKVDEDHDGNFEEATAETDTTGLSRLALNATYNAAGAVTGGTANLTQSQAAVDASLVVNGLTVTRSSNTIADVIPFVTLTLLKGSSGSTLTLTVAKDKSAIVKNVNEFVGAYNSVAGLARSLSVPEDGKKVLLTGDSTARGILNSLRSGITTSYSGSTPARFGLSHNRSGVLTLDTKVLEGALDTNAQGVLDTFNGMAEAMEDVTKNFITTMIPARTDGLRASVKRTQAQIDALNRRLATLEKTYQARFIALEKAMGQLQQSGDFLSQQLSALSSITGGNGS
ncbi:MAG: flagellar filament capping protein FliD [Nitrospirota bacterium]